MTKVKPPCSDFIIATIRYLRPKSAKGRMCGVRFHHVVDTVLELYSEEDLRSGIKSLLDSKSLVIFSALCYTKEYKNGKEITSGVFSKITIQDISALPIHTDNRHRWFIDANSNTIEKPVDGQFSTISEVHMYLVADGLPKKVFPNAKMSSTKTQAILASMQPKAD